MLFVGGYCRLLRRLTMFPGKTGLLHPLILLRQVGGLGEPVVFLLQDLQADLVLLELLSVAQLLVNEDMVFFLRMLRSMLRWRWVAS